MCLFNFVDVCACELVCVHVNVSVYFCVRICHFAYVCVSGCFCVFVFA